MNDYLNLTELMAFDGISMTGGIFVTEINDRKEDMAE